MEYCKSYTGVTCINGNCPIANRDKYAERGYDIIDDCDECPYYEGCEDCCWSNNNGGCDVGMF